MDHLYFIRDTLTGRVKVGRSQDVRGRLAAFQTGCPTKLELVLVIPGAGHMEAELHHAFDTARVAGEWFEGWAFDHFFAAYWPPYRPSVESNLCAIGHALLYSGRCLETEALRLARIEGVLV